MKKFFITFTMMLLGLFAGVSTMWATDPNPETDYYWAKLTARPSTGTGGSGKVYVSNTSTTPAEEAYQNESSAYSSKDSYVQIAGNVVGFSTYAKADDGSYFVGWSDFNGGTEKAQAQSYECGYEPSAKRGISNALEYAIYATFEPIRIPEYSVSGTTELGPSDNKTTLTLTFNFGDQDAGKDDFEKDGSTYYFLSNQKGGGTWKKTSTNSFTFDDTGTLTAKVQLTDVLENGEYGITLTIRTKAGVSVDIPLTVRKVVAAPGNAVLFDGNTQMATGTVAEMLAVNTSAYTNPILKLSGDYSDAVAINKDITFDLNGYTLSNTLTVSGGDVTLAYSPFGGAISSNVSVTGGKLILTGGTITGNINVSAGATLEQNGAAITGDVTNAGTLTTTDGSIAGQLASSGALTLNGGTFTNNSGAAIAITGGTAQIKRGTISGSTYGVQTSGGTTTIEKLAVITGGTKALYGNGGTLTVNNGKFTDPANLIAGTVTFKAGYFQTHSAGTDTALGKQVLRNRAGVEYREGYEFFVGDQAAAQASNVSVCRINTTAYPSLEDALAYANNNPSKSVTIFMENDYVLGAGYYTIPANATLVVPMSDDQNIAYPYITHRSESAYPTPYVFRTLTFASGVNMSVLGTIELSGEQFSKSGDPEQSIPGGPYGRLILKPGSHVTLNDGGELRAWGYVTGDGTRAADGTYLSGEIDARRGSSVREQFQIGDWKGGDVSFTMIQDKDPQQKMYLFPIYEYFIQNVESPVKYHPGSALYCSTSVSVADEGSINAYANDIKVVGKMGEPAMFLMDEMADAENTWVRKWYDANKDQQVYEINSGAQLGSMVINLGEVSKDLIDPGQKGDYNIVMDSRKYILPLTSNMKIHLLSGYMQFTQSTACLPGMEVEIDKESTISLINQNRAGVVEGALYFYDSDQWGTYVRNGKYGTRVHYSATLNGQPTARNVSSAAAIGDAILNVHGTFQVDANCAVYTTVGKTKNTVGGNDEYSQDLTKGGASIISTNEDAGTFIFNANAPVSGGVTISDGMFVWNAQGELNPEVLVNYDNSANGLIINPTARGKSAHIYGFELCTSALLKNGDGSFTQTEGTIGGNSFCFIDGRWTDMKVDEHNYCFMVDGHEIFYAKPAEYVAISATKNPSTHAITGNADHTFSDYDGTGRLFILMEKDCQWWEVEKKDNLYHCIHPDNDTYYYWDDDDKEWKEQRFTITWLNWDGTKIKSYIQDGSKLVEVSYSVTYGTQAEFLGSNPTREPNIDYTYDFTGWTPALGKVTSNVTYTATYSEQPRKYTIIFTTEGGVEIERQFLTHNELPVCENVPTKTGFTLQWEPALAAVTGDATYRATWLPEPPTEYEITFVDYNGTTVLQQGNVAVGTLPTAPTITDGIPAGSTGKPATSEFTYIFDHWSPALEEVTQAMTYTAVYSEVEQEYTITFKNEGGSSTIETRQYHYGETPVCSTPPTKANTAQYTYALRWTPQIQTVMGDATYTAVFDATTNKYSVTLQCSPSGAAVLSGSGLYNYNASATAVTLTATPNAGYEFLGWSDNQGGLNTTRQIAITEDVLLVANFACQTCDNVTIQWLDYDGTELKTVSQAKGTATTYTGETPTRPATSTTTYTFDGWSTTLGGDRVYKNGMTPKAAEGGATYYAHYAVQEIPNLEVQAGATVNLTAPVEYNDLVLVSNGTSSGQLFGADDFLSLTGNAYFEFVVNATARLWYAFAVPWQVDAATGVSVNGHTLQLGKDFDIIYYDGARRAAVGPQRTWNYVANGETLQPGKLYMIVLMSDASAIRFAKKAGTPYLTNSTSVSTYASATGSDTDANWNGIANPALFHAFVNAGATLGQVYQPASETYTPIVMDETKFVVGQAVFVQAPANKSIVVSSGASYAPRRYMKAETTETTKYEVRIAPINTDYTDRVFVQVNEEKTPDIYTVGLDLQKMGVSSKVAQMWINRYDTKLCLNTMAPIEGQVDYPLGIIVPEAGKYTISIKYTANDNSQADLYLTLDGEPIWNLSQNAYTVKLEQGTTARYGLRTIAKAPQTTTDFEPIWVDPEGNAIKAAKVLINNHVYIIRDGKIYTITGQTANIQ